ncbi:ribonuclease P protein component [Celeribacter sp.]|uniref:ribonuclease P protein component n=1 Tax=Celeribacter sp. TaxID=1890673 RepID=UPI003A90ADEE
MTPPDAPEGMAIAGTEGQRSAVLSCSNGTPRPSLTTLTKRADFLRAARARRQGTGSFLLQARKRDADDPATGIRVGYTCSKKVGNAVKRNHAKRRLREIARMVLPELGHDGWDYVLIGKAGDTSARPFELLLKDLRYAMRKVHGEGSGKPS